jgi:hypothetical protein
MLPNVSYEREVRQYQVLDPDTGEIESFPAGQGGRRDAMRRAVDFSHPRLYRIVIEMVQRWPQLEARAWRAANLVIRGEVKRPPDDEALASVASSNEYGDYLVKARGGLIICDCLDYMEGGAPFISESGQRLCKHILATQLTSRLQYRNCGSCGRKVKADLMDCPHCKGPITPF